MKIIIFGSTGSVGKHLVSQALEEGHQVTAFARDTRKIELTHQNLRKVPGDVMDYDSVAEAMPGHDAVMCVLGAGLKGGLRASGTRHIVEAMHANDISRLICQSTLGIGDSRGNLNFFWKYIMFGGLLRAAYADHEQQEKVVKESGLEWTIVRPGAFTDDPQRGTYRHGFSGKDKTTELKVSRADVASFLLAQLVDKTYLHKTPGVSY
jgi:putative NADH-flavin reductase